MRDFIKGFAFFGLLIILIGLVEGSLHNYTMTDCKVINVYDDIVTIEDNTEYPMIYRFCGDGFRIGDKVTVTFHDNYTDDTRLDDEVVEVEKM